MSLPIVGKTNFYITSSNIDEDIAKIEINLRENKEFKRYVCELYYQIGVVDLSEIENFNENDVRYFGMYRGQELIKLSLIYKFYDSIQGDEMENNLKEILESIVPGNDIVTPTTNIVDEIDINNFIDTGLSCEEIYNFYQIIYDFGFYFRKDEIETAFLEEVEDYRTGRGNVNVNVFYWFEEIDSKEEEKTFLILNIITELNEEEVSGIIPNSYIRNVTDPTKVKTSEAELLSTLNKGYYKLIEIRGSDIVSGYKNIPFNKSREIEDLYYEFENIKF